MPARLPSIHREAWYRWAAPKSEALTRLHQAFERGQISAEEFAQEAHKLWRRTADPTVGEYLYRDQANDGHFRMTLEWIHAHWDLVKVLREVTSFEDRLFWGPRRAVERLPSSEGLELLREWEGGLERRISGITNAFQNAHVNHAKSYSGGLWNPTTLERITSESEWNALVEGAVRDFLAFKKKVEARLGAAST